MTALRGARGLSQVALASRAGLTRSSISNIEAGRQNIRLTVLATIAAALEVAPAVLLDEGGADMFMAGWDASARATRARLRAFLEADEGR